MDGKEELKINQNLKDNEKKKPKRIIKEYIRDLENIPINTEVIKKIKLIEINLSLDSYKGYLVFYENNLITILHTNDDNTITNGFESIEYPFVMMTYDWDSLDEAKTFIYWVATLYSLNIPPVEIANYLEKINVEI